MQREIAAWEASRNEQGATVDWHFTTSDARVKLKRLDPEISQSLWRATMLLTPETQEMKQ